jgi:hypothetical protein
MEPQEPSQLRVSDADRHAVAEILREAAGDGRIQLDELDERLEATYAARTYGDLVPITLDLPAGQVPARVEAAATPVPGSAPGAVAGVPERHVMVMSGIDRKGVWTVPQQLTVTCVMGGADLDMREATFAADEVVVTVNAVMGGASLTVGPHVDVIMEGIGIMGGFSGPKGSVEPGPDGRVQRLRVKGFAFWGGVDVTRKA